jgi:hypothetical protein
VPAGGEPVRVLAHSARAPSAVGARGSAGSSRGRRGSSPARRMAGGVLVSRLAGAGRLRTAASRDGGACTAVTAGGSRWPADSGASGLRAGPPRSHAAAAASVGVRVGFSGRRVAGPRESLDDELPAAPVGSAASAVPLMGGVPRYRCCCAQRAGRRGGHGPPLRRWRATRWLPEGGRLRTPDRTAGLAVRGSADGFARPASRSVTRARFGGDGFAGCAAPRGVARFGGSCSEERGAPKGSAGFGRSQRDGDVLRKGGRLGPRLVGAPLCGIAACFGRRWVRWTWTLMAGTVAGPLRVGARPRRLGHRSARSAGFPGPRAAAIRGVRWLTAAVILWSGVEGRGRRSRVLAHAANRSTGRPQGRRPELDFGANGEEGGLNRYGPTVDRVFEVQTNHTRGPARHGDMACGAADA